MKKAFISLSFNKKNELQDEIKAISQLLNKRNIEPFVFVNTYSFNSDQEREMMETAVKEITDSDILIAEVTEKAIGVGIEVGYAYALKKKIVYLYKKGSAYSTTIGGLAHDIIEYNNLQDLEKKLKMSLVSLGY